MNNPAFLYSVNEIFKTFQGEGFHMGVPAFFVRLHGCPVRCPWCDSAGTWHSDFVPKDVIRMSAAEIAGAALQSSVKTVVVTGGEPAVRNLFPLTEELGKAGFSRHLETSGAFVIQGCFEWVTVSPKKWSPPIPSSVNAANEFKIIVETPSDIELYVEMLRLSSKDARPVWLHPEWSHSKDSAVLSAISTAVVRGERNFRAGWQLHKLYQVDRMDARSRPPVPLGGNPEKGY